MQGATDPILGSVQDYSVSIHAPYAGSDTKFLKGDGFVLVSIHAPYAGSDVTGRLLKWSALQFQSTPPMQGATMQSGAGMTDLWVSIHAPYAGSDRGHSFIYSDIFVSIHAPYAGSDWFYGHIQRAARKFQSTPPMQGATIRREYTPI